MYYALSSLSFCCMRASLPPPRQKHGIYGLHKFHCVKGPLNVSQTLTRGLNTVRAWAGQWMATVDPGQRLSLGCWAGQVLGGQGPGAPLPCDGGARCTTTGPRGDRQHDVGAKASRQEPCSPTRRLPEGTSARRPAAQ